MGTGEFWSINPCLPSVASFYIVQGKGTDQDGMVGVVDFDGREGDRGVGKLKLPGRR